MPFHLPVGGRRKRVKLMSKRLDQLIATQEKATLKRYKAEQQEKRIRKQISDLADREHTHRLCTRGDYLEKLLLEKDVFTDEEVF